MISDQVVTYDQQDRAGILDQPESDYQTRNSQDHSRTKPVIDLSDEKIQKTTEPSIFKIEMKKMHEKLMMNNSCNAEFEMIQVSCRKINTKTFDDDSITISGKRSHLTDHRLWSMVVSQ